VPENMTIAVQSFGNAGFHFAKLAKQAIFKIVAISDCKGGIVSDDSLNPQLIMNRKKAENTLKDMLYFERTVCEDAEFTTISNTQ
jgi:glutamate dehydrogenase (NADP+)